jgi:hypothetical protein
MFQKSSYLWQDTYISAVLETDNELIPVRVYDALSAIEQRLLSPIEEGCGAQSD